MRQFLPHRSTSRLVCALLLAAAALPVLAAPVSRPVRPAPIPAAEPVPPEPVPIWTEGLTEPIPPPEDGLPGGGDTWLDSTHSFVGSVFGTVLRFDRFFSDETDLDVERARSFLRWRNELRLGEDSDFTFRTSIRADLRFPGLNSVLERMRLVVTGETEDTLTTMFPDENTTAAADPEHGAGRGNAEIRYGIVETLRTHVSLGGGVLFDFPPGVRGRLRLRHAFPATGSVLVRLGNTAFWDTINGWGDTVQVDFERRFGADTLLRFQNGATISEISRGWEWGTSAAILHRLSRRTAVAAGGGVIGWTEPFPEVTQRRVFLRLRRDLFRSWFFYELEPEILWPVVDGRTQPRVLGIIGRLEFQFHGTEMLGRDAPSGAERIAR